MNYCRATRILNIPGDLRKCQYDVTHSLNQRWAQRRLSQCKIVPFSNPCILPSFSSNIGSRVAKNKINLFFPFDCTDTDKGLTIYGLSVNAQIRPDLRSSWIARPTSSRASADLILCR